LTARAFFYGSGGRLRAPWQWIGFVALLVAAMLVVLMVVGLVFGPLATSWQQQVGGFWSLLVAAWFAHQVMLRWVDRRPWSFVGLGRSQARPWQLGVGLLVGALAILLPSGVLLLTSWLSALPAAGSGATAGVPGSGSWWSYAVVMILFFLPQSLGEEMMSRGYLFATAREAMGWRWALVLTSVLFGLMHMANPGANARSLVLVILAGVFLGAILLATDSLYAAWMAHFAWNWSMAALLHTSVSGLPISAPGYRVVDSGPDWVTGGVWGPEGGVGAALGMMLGILFLVSWRRRRQATLASYSEQSEIWRKNV
jgi:uncharacterized protein